MGFLTRGTAAHRRNLETRHRRNLGPVTRRMSGSHRVVCLGENQFQVGDSRHWIEVVGLDFPKPQGTIQRLGGGHTLERVQNHPAVAEYARLEYHTLHQPTPQVCAANAWPDVEPLRLTHA